MSERNYDLRTSAARETAAPDLAYRPRAPALRARIGIIGCGGISAHHLAAYRDAGWEVTALCDIDGDAAARRRDEFYPDATAVTDYRDLLARREIDVVDITLHPEGRFAVIAAALEAGKHVLSQKPFVLDLDTGERLVAMAVEKRRKLAVNMNGRWAPYARYVHQAIGAGLIGEIQTASLAINWDHTWTRGTPFEAMRHLVIFDFGIHWFDLAVWFFGQRRCRRVQANAISARGQTLAAPLLAQALLEFDEGAATLVFDGHSTFDAQEQIAVTGSAGTIRASGEVCAIREVTITTADGRARAALEGQWFNDGFRGAMAELLCAIDEAREPENSAAGNLHTLSVCFAALHSAETGKPVTPGSVRSAPPALCSLRSAFLR
jgi:predicted dehydrogenase